MTVLQVMQDFVRRLSDRLTTNGMRTTYAVFVTPDDLKMANVDTAYRYQRYVAKWGQYEIGHYNCRVSRQELLEDILYAWRDLQKGDK